MKKVTPSAAAKMLVKDEWVTAAMTDDQMVVELLIRLKHAGTVVSEDPATNLPPLRWGGRQRRSRTSRFGGGGVVSLKKDVDGSARGSPKTPLSWSGGSGSGGGGSASPSADGFEDTSRQASCSTSTGFGSKSSSSELKYQENLKLKERIDLQKEIASLRETFDEQNVKNQRLKRIKLDLNSGHVKNETPRVDRILKPQCESKSCRIEGNRTASSENKSFFLPDLNMVPTEDEVLYGTS
ncbi:hypothetical protein Bca4012_022620 [Brassica carinata]